MMYSLPENPTREDIRREYTIVNMRFRELQAEMEARHREHVSRELDLVRAYLRKDRRVSTRHADYSLSLVHDALSGYRDETAIDVRIAINFVSGLDQRFYALRQNPLFKGSKIHNNLSNAADDLDNVDYQRPETITKEIDKAMFKLGEAEKLILEAEKPVEVGV